MRSNKARGSGAPGKGGDVIVAVGGRETKTFVDLARANSPWIIYYDYREKYASNPVIDMLRARPFEARITTPQFQTSSEKYAWMNQLQAVGKMAELKRTKNDAYVKYDIFGLR